MGKSELIVMLTHNDYTVENAHEIFEACKHTKANYWGFKDSGLPKAQMIELFRFMKQHNKTTILEVVEYTEPECIKGAQLALDCNCDILMGTVYFESVNQFCQKHNIKYMPFVGHISERPSILKGTLQEMKEQAERYIQSGVYGFDLLGYRHIENPPELIKQFVTQTDYPVCVAGSIDSFEKLDLIKKMNPWAFTIGSAFFEKKFDGSFSEQIDKVCEYISENA